MEDTKPREIDTAEIEDISSAIHDHVILCNSWTGTIEEHFLYSAETIEDINNSAEDILYLESLEKIPTK